MKRVITIILIIALGMTHSELMINARENTNLDLICDSIMESYRVIYSDEWKTKPYSEQIEAIDCFVSDVDSLTTNQLLKLMLCYPFKMDYLFFDSHIEGIEYLKRISSIFRTAYARNDFAMCVEALYTELMQEEINNQSLVNTIFLKDIMSLLELNRSLNNNSHQRIIDESIQSRLYGFIADGGTYTEGNTVYKTGWYYKYNTGEYCLKFQSGDYTTSEQTALIYNNIVNHPGWVYQAPPSKKYNCHSYAWISTDLDNRYWINTLNHYPNSSDVTFINTNGPVTISNSRVVIKAGNTVRHSVIASVTTSSNNILNSTQCVSKLGENGVYATSLADMYTLYGGTSHSVYTV